MAQNGAKIKGVLCHFVNWFFSRISQRVISTLSLPSSKSLSLMNPNQYALIKSWAIRSEILRMVSSERYDVTFMRQGGVNALAGFYLPRNRMPFDRTRQECHNQKRMRSYRWEPHPHGVWKCKWIYPCLKDTPDSPRMVKICASSRIGFRLQKIQPPLWQLNDWI